MAMTAYWISYEFSYADSYEDFYKWLASLPCEPRECGIHTVFIGFDGDSKKLKKELSKTVKNIGKAKVYIMRVNEDGDVSGTFLFGKRKRSSPWDDYAELPEINIKIIDLEDYVNETFASKIKIKIDI
jgi:hypothetical protein